MKEELGFYIANIEISLESLIHKDAIRSRLELMFISSKMAEDIKFLANLFPAGLTQMTDFVA
ncbi:MAG: hypothetical protein KDJ52_16585 [Anaerolineae bacterium]|nr:hypothetical protein [Anaerolineae bacterium]